MQRIYLLCVLLCISVSFVSATIEVRSASRTLNLASSLVKETSELVYSNTGSASISTAEIALLRDGLAYFTVTRDGKELVSTFSREQVQNGHVFNVYTVRLKTTVNSGSNVSLKIYAVYGNAFSPKPDEITQSQRQLVVYHGSHFIASPYKIDSQTTKIKTYSSNVLSMSQRKPTSRSGDTTELGPYKNVAAFAFSALSMHMENGAPFLVVTEQLREVEVSHWGNVAIEEHFTLRHTGSSLKGPFSRVDYMHEVKGNSIDEFTQYLPGDAIDIYYRDVIGNISTSHVYPTDDNRVKFQLKPRFVMFGGWKTQYYTGYNLPASRHITVDNTGSRYTLTTNVINDLGDILTEKLETRFILPEGATDIKIDSDVPMTEPEHSLRFTYLDTSGRPVVSIRTSNLIKEHSTKSIRISYTFSSTQILHEPLLVISAYFSLFLIIIVLLRVDLRITKTHSQ